MKKFAKPTAHSRYYSDYKFTAHKYYEIVNDFGSRVDIRDDDGKLVTVRVDGVRSGRLDNGRFDVVFSTNNGETYIGSMALKVEVDTSQAEKMVDDIIESVRAAKAFEQIKPKEAEDLVRLREILRCPAGESIFAHAYAVRAIADLTLERLNQK